MRILNRRDPLSSGKRYEVKCRSVGARPQPMITWWIGGKNVSIQTCIMHFCFIDGNWWSLLHFLVASNQLVQEITIAHAVNCSLKKYTVFLKGHQFIEEKKRFTHNLPSFRSVTASPTLAPPTATWPRPPSPSCPRCRTPARSSSAGRGTQSGQRRRKMQMSWRISGD